MPLSYKAHKIMDWMPSFFVFGLFILLMAAYSGSTTSNRFQTSLDKTNKSPEKFLNSSKIPGDYVIIGDD